MTIAIEKADSISKQLYDILISRDFDVTATDLFGKPVMDPSEVNVFSFNYKTENKSYGHVVIALDSEDNLEIMYSGNMAGSMEGEDKSGWYDFLQLVRNFAKRNMLKFGAKDISKMKYTMQGIAASMNESTLVESYYGNKHTSFADLPESTKLVIKHNKSIGEGDLRYRHIESIFIETADGERFKVPSKSLAEAKALARHVAEGGKPYDRFGKHISEMADECRLLSKLKRKYNGAAELNEDEQDMVNTGLARFESLRKNLKKCAAKKGYGEIKESFIAATTDHKVKESTSMKKQMRELELFENWATSILESSWVMPDSPGRQEELVRLLQGGLTVGPDASNAVNAISELLGDRELHSRLEKIAANDPDADAVPTIIGWMEENSQHASINAVLSSLSSESDQPPADEFGDEEPPLPDEEFSDEEPADDMQEPEQAMPAEPRRESKQNKKRKVECHVKPFAKRVVEHDGRKVEAMVFETTMHAKQYIKANPQSEHLFTDDVGAYVAESPSFRQRAKTTLRKMDPTIKRKLRDKAEQRWDAARLGNPDDDYDDFRRYGPFASDSAGRHIGQHKRFDRLAKDKDPFSEELDEESLDSLAQEYDEVEENRDTQAYIELGGELAQKKPMQAQKFNSVAQWQAAIKKHSPWVDFVKKGEVVFARMGPHILGDFDLSQRRGEIFAESKKVKKSVK